MMKTNKTIQKVKKTLINNNLVSDKDRVLIGLSGGADSVFLVYALKILSEEIGFEIGACHIEHGIRGSESVHDMEFSKKLCTVLNIPFYAKQFNVPAISDEQKISIETAARNIRYSYFEEVCKKYGFNLIATAHHKDDKIETILMNILRGCSLRGYAGIEYKNGSVIRPLLDIKKGEILAFCTEKNIEYCIDSTNEDTDYTRNRVRHIILPVLKETNPSFEDGILRQSEIFSCEDDFLNSEAEKFPVDEGINLSEFSILHKAIRRRVIYKYIEGIKGNRKDISYRDVENALSICESGKTGSRCYIAGSLEGIVSYGKFFIREKMYSASFEYKISLGETIEIKEAGMKITLASTGGNFKISAGDTVAVRSRRDGDAFYPVGMNGSKKVKDYLIDKKIPADKRMEIPILTVNDKIASIVGMRNDRRFFCPDGTCNLIIEKI